MLATLPLLYCNLARQFLIRKDDSFSSKCREKHQEQTAQHNVILTLHFNGVKVQQRKSNEYVIRKYFLFNRILAKVKKMLRRCGIARKINTLAVL